jgi:predicted outer membrane repeat protein
MHRKSVHLLIVCLFSAIVAAACFYVYGCVITANATSNIIYVAPLAQCGSNNPCYAQVQAAVDAANAGDEIRVAAGTYTAVSTRNGMTQVVYLDKSITIRGGYLTSTFAFSPTVSKAILNAQGSGRVFSIVGNVTPTIEYLHLVHGYAEQGGGVYILSATVTLSHNDIYTNTAISKGGGVYLENSTSTIDGNNIYSNTTGASGRGGGLAFINSPATLEANTIWANRAHVGGGVELLNYIADKGALLKGNIIRDNTAFDYYFNGNTFDGAGGGLSTDSSSSERLESNIFLRNIAKRGGGVDTYNVPILILDNTFQQNYAVYHGGGIYAQAGQPLILRNRFLTNTAENVGGGLFRITGDGEVSGNTFRGNTAGFGGGLYGATSATFNGNLFMGNTASDQGGGIFIYRDYGAIYQNNVIIGNHAAQQGGGIYMEGAESRFVHTTIASNVSGDGNAVFIDTYQWAEQPASIVNFTNTIVANQSVGIYATAANTLSVDGVLWYNTATPIFASGAALTRAHEYTGDPGFTADGYHINPASAAANKGIMVAVDYDVDGQLRPVNLFSDLGADEAMLAVVISPSVGGRVTYTSTNQDVIIDIAVPANAVTKAVTLELSPLPVPGGLLGGFGDLGGLGIGGFAGFPFSLTSQMMGPGFGLNAFLSGSLMTSMTLLQPATVTLTYSDSLAMLHPGMQFLNMQLFSIINSNTWRDGACGLGIPDLLHNTFTAPICQIGAPLTTTLRTRGSEALTNYANTYAFVAPIEVKVYLPLVRR